MKKFLFDLFPVILFFLTFKFYDIFVATAVAITATAMQIGWLWLRRHQIEKMMWINLGVIIVFGGATLLSQDETFIKWKPTVLYWLISVILFISAYGFKKNLIQAMLEKQMVLSPLLWKRLNLSWIGFFTFMGGINLYVAFGFSMDTWVTFKLFGATGLMLVFIVLQVMMLNRYLNNADSIQIKNETFAQSDHQQEDVKKVSKGQ